MQDSDISADGQRGVQSTVDDVFAQPGLKLTVAHQMSRARFDC